MIGGLTARAAAIGDLRPGELQRPARWVVAAGRLQRIGPVGRFTLLGVAVGMLVASAVLWFLDTRLTELLLKQAAARATDQVRLGVLDHVRPDDFRPPHTPAKLDSLSVRLAPILGEVQHDGSGMIGVNLIASDGSVLYSDLTGRRGQRVPAADLPLLASALAGGTASDFDALSSEEDADLRTLYESAFEVYVPVVLDGHIVGAYEVYQELTPIRLARPMVSGIIAGVFALLFHVTMRVQAASTQQQRGARRVAVVRRAVRLGMPCQGHGLTPRELEVLKLMATTHTYRNIATKLAVSEETVRSHVKRILHKLGQPDRTQAVVAALEAGILRLS